MSVPAGWYPDPWRQAPWRWWDGHAWTGYAGAGSARRRVFPSRRDRDTTGGIQGGGIALGGAAGAVVLATAFGIAAWLVGSPTLLIIVAGQAGLYAALIGACVIAVRRHGTGSLSDLGLRRLTWRDAGIGAVAGLAARIGTVVILLPFAPLLKDAPSQRNKLIDESLDAQTIGVVAIVVIAAIAAPFFEELFFRGLVQGVLTRRFGAWVAVWGQAACFALAHYVPGMPGIQVFVTFWTIGATGLFLGVLRWRLGRLGPGMVAHGVFNLTALAVLFAIS